MKAFLRAFLAAIAAAAVAAAAGAATGFAFTRVVNRFATPNGDGRNDTIVFEFNNSRGSSGAIRIYTLLGRQVAVLSITDDTTLTSAAWDPRGYGGGVYIYVLSIEDRTYSGAVLVIR